MKLASLIVSVEQHEEKAVQNCCFKTDATVQTVVSADRSNVYELARRVQGHLPVYQTLRSSLNFYLFTRFYTVLARNKTILVLQSKGRRFDIHFEFWVIRLL